MVVLEHKDKITASGAALEEYYDKNPFQWVTVRLPGLRKPHRFKIAKETASKSNTRSDATTSNAIGRVGGPHNERTTRDERSALQERPQGRRQPT